MRTTGQLMKMKVKMGSEKYRALYERGRARLSEAGITDAATDARLLLEYICGTSVDHMYAHGDEEVSEDKAEQYASVIEKRACHVPLQYITGSQDFMGLDFIVNEHVLIPRQDTEILVEEALKNLHDGMNILDMCTGSGCILLSLLHYSNNCTGTGADISQEAVSTADRNAARLGIQGVKWVQGDLFEACPHEKYDMIISNPPYIKTDVIKELMPEVRDHEPYSALDGSEDGLLFYRKITAGAAGYLCGGGCLMFETGFDQGADVSKIMSDAGYRDIAVTKDYAGLDRVVCGFRSAL
jgi:release factor glutamine methyltransferase